MDTNDGTGAVVFTDSSTSRATTPSGRRRCGRVARTPDAARQQPAPSCARVVKELGDGLMLWVPDALAALATCLAVQARVAEQQHGDDPTFVRIGGHWGAPRRRGDDFVGNVVNLAARIVGPGRRGEVLVSAALLDAAGDLSALDAYTHELGPVYVKGVLTRSRCTGSRWPAPTRCSPTRLPSSSGSFGACRALET